MAPPPGPLRSGPAQVRGVMTGDRQMSTSPIFFNFSFTAPHNLGQPQLLALLRGLESQTAYPHLTDPPNTWKEEPVYTHKSLFAHGGIFLWKTGNQAKLHSRPNFVLRSILTQLT